MIYIDGSPFSAEPQSSTQGSHILLTMMEHPVLESASNSLKAISERKFTIPEGSNSNNKCVYVCQREYATVDPALVDLAGTDEATTCVGIAIRNRASGMTSVGHLDSPKVVDIGLSQMLSSVADQNYDTDLDVHLIGGFDDASPQHDDCHASSRSNSKEGGYSFPLCAKIVEALHKSHKRFHLLTLHVLGNNTRWDSDGNATPIFHGFLVETSTGSLIPASFDRTSRCPDELVRKIRLAACSENPSWSGRLLDTYETQNDRFVISPCFWTKQLVRFALSVRELSDTEILLYCSTSPYAEGPDFVENERRMCNYLIRNPDWRDTFPAKQPRIFKRNRNGTWIRETSETAQRANFML